ncbi:hypothetical protein E3P92_01903 [Wallemia ichthyophaga]|uniref:peptidyl-tRNA hydrolase n=2 Tax=Wallemia ichthyophaga TaxID=245174 RepID=A0A4T0IAT2_WALIC|nr:Peptidyl-tRNA hydrolase [Wallemia ichthyophaga EXF-994]TIA72931.1 hypothetical protein E3P91_01786 [Wallemia ichthyophaga]EOR02781.1 Peptidyl-tRNA hydrolase [Wallemia ichthyophaga EXF-994]TIA82034.1 hypothetical protein E3P98_01700 [Wallemia ichthyophaga]TIA91533.1 hypothetical protein E3P97_02004 [Wallemia ichthyophaga]TIB00515.1 hypothetical protein E3P95_01715 [Wallemia ichthyophaga]
MPTAEKTVIAGLGNATHPRTFHSVGQLVLKHLAQRRHLQWNSNTKHGVSYTHINSHTDLIYSHQLMNVCGKSLARYCEHVNARRVLVLHDDLQREWGKLSIKHGGSANGHNGIKSLSQYLKQSLDFDRLRIGIGRPGDKRDVARYVLSNLSPEQLHDITDGLLYTHIERVLEGYME